MVAGDGRAEKPVDKSCRVAAFARGPRSSRVTIAHICKLQVSFCINLLQIKQVAVLSGSQQLVHIPVAPAN